MKPVRDLINLYVRRKRYVAPRRDSDVVQATLAPALARLRARGIPDVVRTGDNGVPLPPADVRAVAAAIEALVLDRPRRGRLRAACSREAPARFALEVQARRYLDLYGRLPPTARRVVTLLLRQRPFAHSSAPARGSRPFEAPSGAKRGASAGPASGVNRV
jgi:hypothetical protein